MSDCYKCQDTETGENSICCDKCDRWTHYSCAKLTQEEVDIIINYYCEECEDDEYLTTWRRVRGTVHQRMIKEKEYYDVEDIIEHRERNGKREFLVEWKQSNQGARTRERSWEPEEHLDGAIDLLQRYCRNQEIPLSSIVGLLGANVDNEGLSRSNWATMDKILTKFQTLKSNWKLCPNIEAKQWDQIGDKDCLYFLDFNFHCFVLLYVHAMKTAYIADGGNLFRANQKTADEIKELVKCRLISIGFDQQTREDHCASSAVLIGIELLRMYSKGLRLQKLICSKFWRDRVAKSFHRTQSRPLEMPPLRQRRLKLTCSFCAKTYKSTERKNLNMHILRTHSDQIKTT